MGLAASQARFLAVTARKTNCEFQSMQIAQNKLSVTRELAQATQDYQNSLNATKLVWDYDCDQSGYLIEPCETARSLAFNTLMVPSIYNNYQPYLITTRTGAVVLNSKYAAAAHAAGITEGVGGQQRSQAGFYRFLDALVTNGLLPESTKEMMDGTTKDANGNPAFQFVMYTGKRAEDGGTTYVYDHKLDYADPKDKKIIDDNRLINEPRYKLNAAGNVILKDDEGNTLETDADGNKIFKNTDGDIVAIKEPGSNTLKDVDGDPISNPNTIAKSDESRFNPIVVNEKGYIEGYDPNAGFGSTPLSKNSMIASNLLGLSIKLDTINFKKEDLYGSGGKNLSDNFTESDSYKISVNGALVDDIDEFSIGDLLTSDVNVIYTFPDNSGSPINARKPELGDIKNAISADTHHFNVNLGKSIEAIITALKENTAYDHGMLNAVQGYVKNLYSVAAMQGEATGAHDTAGAVSTVINQSNNYNSIYGVTTKGNKDNCSVGYSLSNILACVLTLVDRYVNGKDSKYNVSTRVEDSNFVTMDQNYSYPINSSNSATQEMLLLTDFYMQLYNNLCINGWTKNEAVENDYNFNQLIKNGSYFISSINGDGYFYQSRYNSVDKLIEVKDEDAIAQAELEFQRIKASLTYKEDKLDLDMKNLDAEISSLTTELDSVKNLISKNVEKTFTMFQ